MSLVHLLSARCAFKGVYNITDLFYTYIYIHDIICVPMVGG